MVDYDVTGGKHDDALIPDKPTGTPTKPGAALDSLRAEFEREVRNDPITLTVPARPHIALTFDTNIPANTLQAWRKASRDKSMPDGFDSLKFSCIVIANKCTHVLFHGDIATDEKGTDLNFYNDAMMDMLKVPSVINAVQKLYGVDGAIFVAADAILTAAGYNNEEEQQGELDPTLLT